MNRDGKLQKKKKKEKYDKGMKAEAN